MTHISLSNIACNTYTLEGICSVLEEHGCQYIDIAPTKFWPEWQVDLADISHLKKRMRQYGITPYGMQSLFYNTQNLNLFTQKQSEWRLFLLHVELIAQIANKFGISKAVFGSPKNRDPSNIHSDTVRDLAYDRFHALANIVEAYELELCLEPVPKSLQGNFLTNTEDTAEFVRHLNHPCLRMNLDLGAIKVENEDTESCITKNADIIGHVHISEPNLLDFTQPISDHDIAAKAFKTINYGGILAIEMLTTGDSESDQIIHALQFVRDKYE